jgi:predicted nucleic acid-binding protein
VARVLVDTNVLVYAHDPANVEKQALAVTVLNELHAAGSGSLSAQCLAEFFRTATRSRPAALLSMDEAANQVSRLARSFPILPVTSMVVTEAVRGVQQHQLAYWDAQIWAAARLNQVPVVLSEDFRSNTIVEGVRFVNPFATDFVLDAWISVA